METLYVKFCQFHMCCTITEYNENIIYLDKNHMLQNKLPAMQQILHKIIFT